MEREQLLRRLMSTFLDELEEGVRIATRDLLALEKAPGSERGELLQRLFRFAHSLKGAARAVRVKPIETACHSLESLLGQVRDGGREIDPELVELLFAAADALGDAGHRLRQSRGLEDAPLLKLLPRIEAMASAEVAAAPDAPVGGSATIHADRSISATMPSPTPSPPAPAAATGDGVVRVRADKLDAVVARSSELLVARGGLDSRVREVQELVDSIARMEAELKTLPRLLRRMLKGGKTPGAAPRTPEPGLPAARQPQRSEWSPLIGQTLSRTAESFRKLTRELERHAASLERDTRTVHLAAAPLEEQVRRLRMLPLGEICDGLERMARDLAKQSHKEAQLCIEGAEVELDRALLAALKAPLMHMVRNAIDHGIEPPELRRASGKPACGTITISASLHSSQVHIAIQDDGRGLDTQAIRERVRARQMHEPAAARELAEAIFAPGFSTARLITDISGRGIGLDVVKSSVEALHGSVEVAWEEGRGTRFVLKVPLTLTMLRGLVVSVQGQLLAFPSSGVHKLLRLGRDDLHTIEGWPTLVMEGRQVPVVALDESLKMATRKQGTHIASRAPIVIAAVGDARVAFAVDELCEERELVVKSLGPRLSKLPNLAGAAILPSGKVAMVLHTAELMRSAMRNRSRERAPRFAASSAQSRKRLIVAEDTLTTRSLLKGLLEAAGYEVTVAPDGAEAWELLQRRGADLVVSDVEMPRMDGFALAATIRGSTRFQHLPIVLVTGLENDRDKARGMQVGANAYLFKGSFDQRGLLAAISQLL